MSGQSSTPNRLSPSLANRLALNYTTPEIVFYRVDIDGTNSLIVIGGDGEGAYEWVVLKGGAVEKHSDCGYGMADIALRDGLIYCFGLPPVDFMKEIAPKTEPDIIPREQAIPSERPEILTSSDHYRNGWNEALDRCLLAVEGEQAKYIVARSGAGAAAVRGALEYAMNEMRKLRVP